MNDEMYRLFSRLSLMTASGKAGCQARMDARLNLREFCRHLKLNVAPNTAPEVTTLKTDKFEGR